MPRRDPHSDDQFAQMTALIARSAGQGRARLSPLARWLVERHDAFAAMLRQHPASWNAIADALASIGVTDGKGNAPTAERVRKTWWDARNRVSAKRADSSPTTTPPATDEITHGVIFVREGDRHAARSRQRLDVRPALPRDAAACSATPPSGRPTVHAPPPHASSAREADTELQRILHAMDRHKPGIPELITGED
jgi:hypothetical protein